MVSCNLMTSSFSLIPILRCDNRYGCDGNELHFGLLCLLVIWMNVKRWDLMPKSFISPMVGNQLPGSGGGRRQQNGV